MAAQQHSELGRDGGGLTVGLDYRLNDRLAVGLARALRADPDALPGRRRHLGGRAWSIGPYGMFTDGQQYSLYGGGGYDFGIAPGTTLGPTISLQYTHADIDGDTETGSNPFNLTVGPQSLTSLLGSLGAEVALQLSHGTSLFASADGQMSFNRENAALSVNAGVRIAF